MNVRMRRSNRDPSIDKGSRLCGDRFLVAINSDWIEMYIEPGKSDEKLLVPLYR